MSIVTMLVVHCDHRETRRCPAKLEAAEGHRPRSVEARHGARLRGWEWRVASSRHEYDLCPVHRDDVPGETFPDWKAGPSA